MRLGVGVLFLAVFLLPAASEGRTVELVAAPGWQIEETALGNGLSLNPGRETKWFKLIPPSGSASTPAVVGATLIEGIETGELTAEEVYDWATRKKRPGGTKDDQGKDPDPPSEWKNPDTTPPGSDVSGASAAHATSTATSTATGTKESRKEEFLWDLAKPLRKPVVLAGPEQPACPVPKWNAVGASLLIQREMKKGMPPATCQRLKPGEAALIEHDVKVLSPIYMDAVYRLRRLNENTYSAELNLVFEKGEGFDMPMKPEEVDPHYRRLVNSCLEKFAPAFRNPDTGQMLRVILTKDPEVPRTKVEIGGARIRSSHVFWESDIDCPVALHELFHHLGLVDEYDEDGIRPMALVETTYEQEGTGAQEKHEEYFEARFDCRAISPQASLMHWHVEAAAQAAVEKVKVDRCYCDKGVNCISLRKKYDGKACPKGSRLWTRMIELQPGAPFKPAPDDEESFHVGSDFDSATGRGKLGRSAILYPAHFRAITEPGCEDVNWKYYACARNAYRFSKALPPAWESWGVKRLDYQGCLPDPADCRHGYNWLK